MNFINTAVKDTVSADLIYSNHSNSNIVTSENDWIRSVHDQLKYVKYAYISYAYILYVEAITLKALFVK